MKVYYLARYMDENVHSRTFGQEVVRPVSADGFARDGLRVDRRWCRIVAANMAEAREKLARGDGLWLS